MANDEPKTNPVGFNLPAEEEKVLKFWEEHHIFEKTLARHKPKSQRAKEPKSFVFYEGPPTANGRPGIHHILARAFKDLIPRYKTMRGYYVPRKGGWDTHGLPVEIEVEKELGLKSKKDIEKFGIAEFNRRCKESVWKYKDEWERLTRRMGFWLDLKDPYITYEPSYIETLWWIIAQVWKKKLLYKGHRVVPWCTRCGTALSSHELAQGYKETTDASVYVKFRLKPGQKIGDHNIKTDDKIYILSWTTTPWTLPGNVALAVGSKIEYRAVQKDGEYFIAAADRLKDLGFEDLKISHQLIGAQMVGLEYEPLFAVPSLRNDKAYKVYAADFVTTTDGTGVVHTAVMYGEDDYQLGKKVGLPQVHTVNEEGRFKSDVPGGLAGMLAKSKDPPVTKETEDKIFEHLKKHGNFLRTEAYKHEYPFCWRCGTPILYYARDSWFIGMSKLRPKLLASNKKINWVPANVKEGRFGEWLKEAKDWNFSRERYWGTPMPVFECAKCGHTEVVGSLDEFSARAGGPKNNYWVMRHGESLANVMGIIDSGQAHLHLTAKGRKQVEASARKLKQDLERKKEKIDLIFSSDITRTRETEHIARAVLGVHDATFDKRLEEIHLGTLTGCHDDRYHVLFPTYESKFEQKPEGGESLRDLRARLWQFLAETEKHHHGKNILIVSHEYPIWMLFAAADGWDEKRSIREKTARGDDFFGLADMEKLPFRIVPRNETGEVDLHRPYADAIEFPCAKCDGKMRRIKEVADVWFDSGSMPFAQGHYPFENKEAIDKKLTYPAGYISEAVDQTRGWFYTLLSVATLLDRGAPYENVICLGHINDRTGQKMSKSKGNIVDPWAMMDKYGADAVRWHFYTVNPPGEPKNFDELEVAKAYRRMHLILYNSLVFWKTYAKGASDKRPTRPENILDTWILARLDATIAAATGHLEKYNVREAALSIEELVDDLSRWYIRRSRRRLQKPMSESDFKSASATMGFVIRETIKLIAPFTPFFAEILHKEMGGLESVHLESWPKAGVSAKLASSKKMIEAMKEARRLASVGLAKRAEKGIKVRQPLASLTVRDAKLKAKISKEILAILADEVNVKKIIFGTKNKDAAEVELDTVVTPELREEGIMRDLVRSAQDLRQEAGLKPKDGIAFMISVPDALRDSIARNEKLLKVEVGAKEIEYKRSEKFKAEATIKIEGAEGWIGLRKI